jgi:hypothetical protein
MCEKTKQHAETFTGVNNCDLTLFYNRTGPGIYETRTIRDFLGGCVILDFGMVFWGGQLFVTGSFRLCQGTPFSSPASSASHPGREQLE